MQSNLEEEKLPEQMHDTTTESTDSNKDFLWGPAALAAKRSAAREHQTRWATVRNRWILRNTYFYNMLKELLRFIIEPHKRVLNVRCQNGFLLEALEPSYGVGVEISQEMVDIAKKEYPQFEFVKSDPENLERDDKFDYILFDQVSDTVDVLSSLRRLKNLCQPHTRMVIYTYSHLWRPIIQLAERLRLKMPMLEPNWLSETDLRTLLLLSGYEWLHTYRVSLFPKWVPIFSALLNRFAAKIPGINKLCMICVVVARPVPSPRIPEDTSVSVVVPCKNEFGNIQPAIERIPDMGKDTEIIFCDDLSTDGTADEVRRIQREYPERNIKLVTGPGICKSENVWTGFRAAQGEILMILDADLTVMPEELPFFFNSIVEGKGEFINGSRMVYPMQKMAMKFFNMLGNKFFSFVFSFLLSQPVKDTLCGTKVLWRSDWERIHPMLGTWGIVDRWGDYELLFAAAKLNLKIVDLPVHYQERIYGTTKMVKVFHNGLIMLRMCLAAFMRLKKY